MMLISFRLESQLVNGCKRDICINVHCFNNPNFLFKGKTPEELKVESERLLKEIKEKQSLKLTDVVCHVDFMGDITRTVQVDNLEELSGKADFIAAFTKSPYALSLSFLKDRSIIGKNDDFGQLKYNLNLDEEAVMTFYSKICHNTPLLIEIGVKEFGIHDADDEDDVIVKAHSLMFKTAVTAFKDSIESYLREEETDFKSQYQVSIPFVLRGLLIHLMNEALDISHFMGEIECINQLLASLVSCNKETGNYFERYLTQLSLKQFTKIVQRI